MTKRPKSRSIFPRQISKISRETNVYIEISRWIKLSLSRDFNLARRIRGHEPRLLWSHPAYYKHTIKIRGSFLSEDEQGNIRVSNRKHNPTRPEVNTLFLFGLKEVYTSSAFEILRLRFSGFFSLEAGINLPLDKLWINRGTLDFQKIMFLWNTGIEVIYIILVEVLSWDCVKVELLKKELSNIVFVFYNIFNLIKIKLRLSAEFTSIFHFY